MPDGTGLLFNFYTLNLITLDSSESILAHKILKDPNRYHKKGNHGNLFDLLIQKGFIIGDQISELDLLKEENQRSRTDRRNLSLTILPSLACNFRCVYCYQEETGEECPYGCVCLTDVEAKRLGYVLCQGERIACGYVPGGPSRWCYQSPD